MMCDAIDLVTIKKFGRLLLCMWFVAVIMVHWILLCYRGHTYRCQIWVQAGDLLSFLWYDKLWGPSQRVVTLFMFSII